MGVIIHTSARARSKEECYISGQQAAELLEVNGKKSSLKRTRHINIRYFLVTDAIAKEECEVKWISCDYMFADYLTKAQQGAECCVKRDFIMGVNPFEERYGGI